MKAIISKHFMRLVRLSLTLLVSAIVLATFCALAINLWIKGLLLDDDNAYSFSQQLINNQLLSVEYDKSSLNWNFLSPNIKVDSLTLSTDYFVAKSDRVHISVDLWQSMVTGVPVISELFLIDNNIELRVGNDRQQQFDWQRLQQVFINAQYWHFENSVFIFKNTTTNYDALIKNFHIENQDDFMRVIVEGKTMSAIAELQSVNSIERMYGDVYFNIATQGLNRLSNLIKNDSVEFTEGQVELWATIKPQLQLSGYALIDAIASINGQNTIQSPIDYLNFNLTQQDLYIKTPESLALTQLAQAALSFLKASKQPNVKRQTQLLEKLQLNGLVNHLMLKFPFGKANLGVVVSGELEKVAMAAINKAPAFNNISGAFEARNTEGYIAIDSNQFGVHLKRQYSEPISVDSVKGKLYWHFEQANNQVRLYADAAIEQQGNTGSFNLSLLTPIMPLSQKATPMPYHDFKMKVGMHQLPLNQLRSLLPIQTPPQVINFINSAILIDSNQHKVFDNAGFVLHEVQTEQFQSDFQIATSIDNFNLKFLPDWQSAQSLTGKVTINNGRVDVAIEEGEFMATKLSMFNAQIINNTQDLTISGNLLSDGNHLLDIVRQSPLRINIGNQFDSIDLTGTAEADFTLAMPLKTIATNPSQQRANVVVKLDENRLFLQDVDIAIEKLSGLFNYQLKSGVNIVQADTLTASIWDKPLTMTIDSNTQQVNIDLKTQFDVKTLDTHFGLNVSEFITGSTAVSGMLHLPFSKSLPQIYRFIANSDGVVVDLPFGFGKQATEANQFDVKITKTSDRQYLNIDYQSPQQATLNGLFDYSIDEMRKTVLEAVVVQLNQQQNALDIEQLLVEDNLVMNVNLAESDQQTWVTLIERFSQVSQPATNANQGLIMGLQPAINIDTNQFQLGDDFELADVSASVASDDSAWQLSFTQPAMKGQLSFYHDDQIPKAVFKQIDLTQLMTDSSAATQTVDIDTLAKVEPQSLPSAMIEIEQLVNEGVNLGSWSFAMRPIEDGILFNNIESDIIETVEGFNNQLAWILQDSQHFSNLSVNFTSRILPDLVNQLIQQDYMASDFLALNSQLQWQGSPVAIDIDSLQGDASFTLKDGSFKAASNTTDFLSKVVSLINLDNWARRLRLDFSDVTTEGTAFNSITGQLHLQQGNVEVVDFINAKLTASKIHIKGSANTLEDSIDGELVLKLPIIQNSAWLAGFLVNLPAAAGVFLISKLFSKKIENLTDVTYTVKGKLSEPDIKLKDVKRNKSP